ncbi:MAG: L(+)-tartrate dehydratase subunit beta [Desulfobacterota bacterium]|nr:L(+)-tartrate dehydratase subunit beta [Thermodesulfobacteriota bacterium]MDW8002034.1 L(+)-tartrate dehydratase subunit beta [Deltaproteobacteria bacterium]
MKKLIHSPVRADEIEDLKIGDIFWLEGTVLTIRDVGHRRVVVDNIELPVRSEGLAIFHAGPIVKKEDGRLTVVSIGPTTSMRMEKYEYEFIRRTKVKIVIGKGGMGKETQKACAEFKAIHCIYPGGCGALCAKQVVEIADVKWTDLGMPEALYVLKVKDFGPLVVSIDTQGRNLMEERKKVYISRKEEILGNLLTEVKSFR